MSVARCAPAIVLVGALLLSMTACSSPAPTPTPRPPPSTAPTPTLPAAPPVPTVDPSAADVQDAFLTNVNDLTSDVETLATATCSDLAAETTANPTEVSEMRGFAATMQRLGASQAMLQSDDVRAALD